MTNRRSQQFLSSVVLAVVILAPAGLLAQQDAEVRAPALSREEMRHFLLTARVTGSRDTGKGVTSPARLTLTDGRRTQDAVFQRVDVQKTQAEFARGGGEVNFVDSYRYNLAAYALAELLDLDHMMPVTVPYRWGGAQGSLAWWVDWKWDEGTRVREKVSPPRPLDWTNQLHRMRVFSQLVYDTDRNTGNVLITEDWRVFMIDFTRAFRLHRALPGPAALQRCDRRLFERLRAIDPVDLQTALRPYLNRYELDATLARRALIVNHFEALIAAKGEAAVLY